MNVHVNPDAIDRRLAPLSVKLLGAPGGLRVVPDVRPASRLVLVRQARAKTQMRYQLRGPDGAWANIDLSGLADTAADGWIGFAGQLEAARRVHPEFAAFKVVPVFPVGKSGIVP